MMYSPFVGKLRLGIGSVLRSQSELVAELSLQCVSSGCFSWSHSSRHSDPDLQKATADVSLRANLLPFPKDKCMKFNTFLSIVP